MSGVVVSDDSSTQSCKALVVDPASAEKRSFPLPRRIPTGPPSSPVPG